MNKIIQLKLTVVMCLISITSFATNIAYSAEIYAVNFNASSIEMPTPLNNNDLLLLNPGNIQDNGIGSIEFRLCCAGYELGNLAPILSASFYSTSGGVDPVSIQMTYDERYSTTKYASAIYSFSPSLSAGSTTALLALSFQEGLISPGSYGQWRYIPEGETFATFYGAPVVLLGDVPVAPEPISSILFVTGGTLLAGRRYMKRKKIA